MKLMMKLLGSVWGRSEPNAPGAKAPGAYEHRAETLGKDWRQTVSRPIFVTKQFRNDVAAIFGGMSRNDKELSALATVIEGSPIYTGCLRYPDDIMRRNFCTVDVNVNDDPRVVALFQEKLVQTAGRVRVAPVHIHPMNYPMLSATDISTYEAFRKSTTEPSPLGIGKPYPVILINLKESYNPELLGFWVMEGKMFATGVETIDDDSKVVENAWKSAKPLAYFTPEAELARRIDQAAGPKWSVTLGVCKKTGEKALLVKGETGRVTVPLRDGGVVDLGEDGAESHVDWDTVFTHCIENERRRRAVQVMNTTKIMVSSSLKNELVNLPKGALILGVWSPAEHRATITGISRPGDNRELVTRCILAVAGEDGTRSTPFKINSNGGMETRDGNHVEMCTFAESDFFKRTPFNPELMAALSKERVLVVGCGSVGSAMSLELAKNGVGLLILADMDDLEIHNSMRHVLGAGFVGIQKTIALKNLIEEHVPMCRCVSVPRDMFVGDRTELRKVMDEYRPTRILAVTDAYHIQNLCQLTAVHYSVPFMAVSCGTNAVEGEVFLWNPGQAKGWREGRQRRGCYFCAHGLSVGGHRSSAFDYSSDAPGSYGGEPALGAFISRINSTATTIMLSWMLKDYDSKLSKMMVEKYEELGLQYIRIGGPYLQPEEGYVTSKAPWGVEWMRTNRIVECPICGDGVDTGKILFSSRDITKEKFSWEEMDRPTMAGTVEPEKKEGEK